jgi:hypothetical protein
MRKWRAKKQQLETEMSCDYIHDKASNTESCDRRYACMLSIHLKQSALPKYFFVEHKLVGGADGSGEGSRLHGITQRIAPAHKHSNSNVFQLPVDVPASALASNLAAQVQGISALQMSQKSLEYGVELRSARSDGHSIGRQGPSLLHLAGACSSAKKRHGKAAFRWRTGTGKLNYFVLGFWKLARC